MEKLDTATQAANWFQEFIKHTSFISLLLALGGGWGFSITASYPIHWNVKDDERATFYSRMACILGTFLITALTWPNEFRFAWAFVMAFASPILGLIALAIIKNRWPSIFDALAMKKTSPPAPPSV